MPQQKIFIAADALVFDKTGEHLKILLIKRKNDPFKGMWGFPGGFVENDEELEDAAVRELQEETGVTLPAMKQLHTFGTVGRDPRFRTVSVAHYAFVNSGRHPAKGSDDAAEAKWVDVKDITELAFDHVEILDFALQLLEEELAVG